jgi:DNA-binding CsgD family transcriptional regulator
VDFLGKPIQPEEVQARVQTHLRIRELQGELEEKNKELAEEIELRLDAERELEGSLSEALLIADLSGQILFATRQARIYLSTYLPEPKGNTLPALIMNWLAQRSHREPLTVEHPQKGSIQVDSFGSPNHKHAVFLRMERQSGDQGPEALLRLGLTAREAEVLYWITEGKTNPEIAIILGASLNTVKKHANNLFAKLGVETRTAAARAALEVLSGSAV